MPSCGQLAVLMQSAGNAPINHASALTCDLLPQALAEHGD